MGNDLKKYPYQLLLKLSSEEKREVISFLEGESSETGQNLASIIEEIRKRRFASGYHCPIAPAAWWLDTVPTTEGNATDARTAEKHLPT